MSWSARKEDDTREYFDTDDELRRKAQIIAENLKSSRHGIIFTGAGLSTSAGIPDFRSGLNTVLPTGPGLWAAQAAYERRTNGERSERTKNDPSRPKVDLDKFLHVEPTYSHKAIAALVERGYIKCVLTQNVDNLHRRSGVPRSKLCELHGNLQCEKCDTCGKEYLRNYRIGPNMETQHYTGRRCEDSYCNGFLKDYLVPFGEDLPKSEVSRAWNESDKADFCLSLGSSLTVTPACDYAGWVGQKTHAKFTHPHPPAKKGFLGIINIQKTPYDHVAGAVCNGFCDKVMEMVMEEMGINLQEEQSSSPAQVNLVSRWSKNKKRQSA